jgi:predicted nucleic acid-binding protein
VAARIADPDAVPRRSLLTLASYEELDIERFNVDLPATVRIAETYSLSSYDTAYLGVAGHLRAPIATFDARLAAAARSYLAPLPEPD